MVSSVPAMMATDNAIPATAQADTITAAVQARMRRRLGFENLIIDGLRRIGIAAWLIRGC
jgi:hypothetical protein